MLTKEQLELRRSGIGASEIAVLAGLSRWSSPVAIYESKVSDPPDTPSLAADLGTMLEEPVAQLYSARTGFNLATCGTLRHPVQAFALATPDRIAFPTFSAPPQHIEDWPALKGADRNVEIKTTTWRLKDEWGEEGTDQVPEYYLAQVTWQMGVTGLTTTDVAVLFDRDEWRVYTVPFNEELWFGLLEVGGRFWRDNVLAGVPPPPDASDRYKEFLGRAFPGNSGTVLALEAGDVRESVMDRYAKLQLLEKWVGDEKKLAANQLRSFIGDNKGLTSATLGSLSKVWNKPGTGTDWEGLARAALTPEQLNALVPQHQSETRAGYWKLMPRWSKEWKSDAASTLRGGLERLGLPAGAAEEEIKAI
jgi:putative phage-type endonuclease